VNPGDACVARETLLENVVMLFRSTIHECISQNLTFDVIYHDVDDIVVMDESKQKPSARQRVPFRHSRDGWTLTGRTHR
jgi:hypothetical protein